MSSSQNHTALPKQVSFFIYSRKKIEYNVLSSFGFFPYMYLHVTWEQSLLFSKYGLLTKCEVKMMGYWPSSFSACLWTETELRSIDSQKKERGQYPAILTEQAWSIKDLLYGFRGNFSCGTRQVVPSGQDSSILPARVANHSAGFDSSCLLTELAI